ncbi:MAG: tetratricopeptide repeat protein [Rhodospirillales bacterium]|nr:tetratricopeptide repeat protein [Rhodospirillales bacterium]
MTNQNRLTTALSHHRAGRLEMAAALYEEVLAVAPEEATALRLSAHILLGRGEKEAAVERLERAVRAAPGDAVIRNDLGAALRLAGRVEEAAAAFEGAVGLQGDYGEGWHNLGLTRRALGDLEGARAALERAAGLRPGFGPSWNALGVVRDGLGDAAGARDAFQRAIDTQPDYVAAWLNLGKAEREADNRDTAAAAYRQAYALAPEDAEALNGIGLVHMDAEAFEEARASWEKALAIRPDYFEARHNLGNVLRALKRYDEAVVQLRRAVELQPEHADAWITLGGTLRLVPDYAAAIMAFQRAQVLKPDSAQPLFELAICDFHLCRTKEAIVGFRQALKIDPLFVNAWRHLLYVMAVDPDISPQDELGAATEFAARYAAANAPATAISARPRDPDRILNIGFASSDFRRHPVGGNIDLLVAHLDRERYRLYFYADLDKADDHTERMRAAAAVWRDVRGLDDADVAKLIREDDVDILHVLAGRFDGNRMLLPAHRAAPIHVSFHDIGTSGISIPDYYYFTDATIHPPGTKHELTERLIRLPHFFAFRPESMLAPAQSPPCLHAGRVTFGSFNNPIKFNPGVARLWGAVLAAVPNSRLVMKYMDQFRDPGLRARILASFADAGVAPERIELHYGKDERKDLHLSRYDILDIVFDPFPFTGATTTFQALWMGVPVVTLRGDGMAKASAASILVSGGFPELVADSPDDYVAKAAALARNPARLAEYRATMRARFSASPLFDHAAYARSVERAWQEIWRQWCRT